MKMSCLIFLDLGKAEGVIRKDQTIPRESLRNGDRVRAYIYDVRAELKGPQIFQLKKKDLPQTHKEKLLLLVVIKKKVKTKKKILNGKLLHN